jgi:precorrin-3B synthase
VPTRPAGPRSGPDACPGALRLHDAADGALARVRLPGGRIAAGQLAALAALAARFGDGNLELTSRGNAQLRGLSADAAEPLAAALSAAGLLPSRTHELVRNIVASPLADLPVRELDAALRADPGLAALPGRFLFALDGGSGDTLALRADLTALPDGEILLAGHRCGLPGGDPLANLLAAAHDFLDERAAQGGTAWRLSELDNGPAAIAARAGGRGVPVLVPVPTVAPPVGVLPGALGVLVPLGRLTQDQAAALLGTRAPAFTITPWRGIVVPGQPATAPLAAAGLVLDASSPWAGVTACAGLPGCAKSRADVRSDAAANLPAPGPRPVHWIGCDRGCGSPSGEFTRVLATGGGYEISRGGRILAENAPAAAVREIR